MSSPIKEISIGKLYLDQHNIRTPISSKDQNALIRDMFANERAFESLKVLFRMEYFPMSSRSELKRMGKSS